MKNRVSGVLLHPTSLPGRYGIGDLGQEARRFIDYLQQAGQSLWQVLPLGPVGYGESPYSSYSSFAGNPMLISPDALRDKGWLTVDQMTNQPDFPVHSVDFPAVRAWKEPLLNQAAKNFLRKGASGEKAAFDRFCEEEAFWLDDYALFMAVKEHYDGLKSTLKKGTSSWNRVWEPEIRRHTPEAVAKWSEKLATRISQLKVIQYFFFSQWIELKDYANGKGVEIIGDIPIFVAPDSADVWSRREMFLVDEDCELKKVAGVPPDYFSPTGQRWGNPLYDWKAMKKDGFSWWIERIRALLKLVDVVRIDHFRGFEAYWEIPADEETAENGKWIKAPGEELFTAIREKLGRLPIIAEDLGHITPEVHKLRRKFRFPGMKIIQFAFEMNENGEFNCDNGYLPHNYEESSVVYTGTHDNDTTLGWYMNLPENIKDLVRRYFGRDGNDIVWDLIRSALASPSYIALFPMQDLLGYGSDSRMNTPSTVGGTNWAWRFSELALDRGRAHRLNELCSLYGRLGRAKK